MLSQHENLVRSMLWFLADDDVGGHGGGGGGGQRGDTGADPSASPSHSRVWVVAGFHTGRAVVASFFDTAVRMGLEIERIYERDLIFASEDGKEVRRDWVPVREGEGPENRGRWCVVAVLRRAGNQSCG